MTEEKPKQTQVPPMRLSGNRREAEIVKKLAIIKKKGKGK